MADYSYLGSGRVYLRDRGATGGLIEVGNCSALSFAITEDAKELKDFTQPGGGTYNEVKRISAVESTITMHDFSPENLSRAVYGGTSSITSAAVVDEVQTAYKGAFVPFAFLPASTPAPVIKNQAGSTTYVEGTDYELRPGGIKILTAGAIVDASQIKCSYTKAGADVVQALITSGKEYEIVFDGLNEARSGKRTRITAHRVKVGAAKQLDFIGEDYGALEVTGKLLKDTTKTGANISQYFKVEIEQ